MNVEILARLQFALTIMFHYIYPPLSIGLGLILVIMEGCYMKTGNVLYLTMAKFWTRVFALTFALGVATGIVMEFEFGTNWSNYSRYVGDVFGSALAAEGVFAFFLESGFLALLLFGWDRVKKTTHYFATVMVCLGAHFSAIWIVVANSWMQTPAGFKIAGEGMSARAEITEFWSMVFNPSSMHRLSHTVIGAWLAGAFLVISVSAYYLLKKRHIPFAKESLKIGLVVASVALILQGVTGHISAGGVARNQPSKFAAFEAQFRTEKSVPYILFGIVNMKEERIDYALRVPGMLSYLAFEDAGAEVFGLDKIEKKDWPQVAALFYIYRTMILMWVVMTVLVFAAWILWKRGTLYTSRSLLFALAVSALCPQIANQAGWIAAEMGRYPWIVYGLLRISEGLSESVKAHQVLSSIIMFGLVYTLLFILFIYLLNEKFRQGPTEDEESVTYHHLQQFVIEKSHDPS